MKVQYCLQAKSKSSFAKYHCKEMLCHPIIFSMRTVRSQYVKKENKSACLFRREQSSMNSGQIIFLWFLYLKFRPFNWEMNLTNNLLVYVFKKKDVHVFAAHVCVCVCVCACVCVCVYFLPP